MNRYIYILIVTAMILAAGKASAQLPKGLAGLFDGPYLENKNATETIITGNPLKPYSLSLFHSLAVSDNANLALPIEKAVRSDGAKAIWKETVNKGGRLESGVYELPKTKHRRYILYLNSFIGGGNEATVIYLEGKATPQQIKKLIKTITD